MEKHIKKAIEVLKQGGIVIFPTDTAFGIGCVIDNENAVKKLFKIRKRPENKATPVLVDTVKMAQDYLQPIPKDVIDRLIEPYWPGGLTIVLPGFAEKVPDLVRGGGKTIGVRIPAHPVIRAIIRGLGKPVLGPSANFAGEKTPYKLSDLNPDLLRLVDYVVEEEAYGKEASTVIDCSVIPWKILREGVVKIPNKKVSIYIDTSSNE